MRMLFRLIAVLLACVALPAAAAPSLLEVDQRLAAIGSR